MDGDGREQCSQCCQRRCERDSGGMQPLAAAPLSQRSRDREPHAHTVRREPRAAHLADCRQQRASPHVGERAGTYKQAQALDQGEGAVGGRGRGRQQSSVGETLQGEVGVSG